MGVWGEERAEGGVATRELSSWGALSWEGHTDQVCLGSSGFLRGRIDSETEKFLGKLGHMGHPAFQSYLPVVKGLALYVSPM